jgi:hypothetical protein
VAELTWDVAPDGQFARNRGVGWSIGLGGDASLSPDLSTVRLAPGLDALVIRVVAGFDHLHESFEVWAPWKGKLLRVWAEGPSAAPLETGVHDELRALPGENGDQRLVMIRESPTLAWNAEQPDGWSMSALRWDAGVGKLVEDAKLAARIPVHAAIACTEKTLAAARKRIADSGDCLSAFRAIQTSAFPKLTPGLFACAALDVDERRLAPAFDQAKRCAPGAKPYLKQVR